MILFNTLTFNKTSTLIKHIYYKIPYRTMFGRISKMGKEMVSTVSKHDYSIFTITNNSYSGDTSKTNHNSVLQQKCDTTNCQEKNCAKDISECDPETLKTYSVGHKTNNASSVETDKKVYELENDPGSRGTPAKTVIYTEKEPIDNNFFYDNLSYKETQIAQTDSNTKKLNEATKNLPEKKSNENDTTE